MSLKLSDRVTWTSQSAGVVRTKVGTIIEVVPPHTMPTTMTGKQRDRAGLPRDHETYVVKAYPLRAGDASKRATTYWPRVGQLQPYTGDVEPPKVRADGRMGASTFYRELHACAQRFAVYWERNHYQNPDHYPLHLSEGDWWDQFLMWATTSDGKDANGKAHEG